MTHLPVSVFAGMKIASGAGPIGLSISIAAAACAFDARALCSAGLVRLVVSIVVFAALSEGL